MSKHPSADNDIIDPELMGDLLEAVQPQAPPPSLRAKVLARALGPSVVPDVIAKSDSPAGEAIHATAATDVSPEPCAAAKHSGNMLFVRYADSFMTLFDVNMERACEILNKAAAQNDGYFVPCGIPGTQLFYFEGGPRAATATCGVVKIAAGAIFPAHEHQGDERVIILHGSATEQTGRRYHPGDVIHCKKGSRHSFRVHADGSLIFAVLLEKPNKWLLGQIILDFVFRQRRFVNKNNAEHGGRSGRT